MAMGTFTREIIFGRVSKKITMVTGEKVAKELSFRINRVKDVHTHTIIRDDFGTSEHWLMYDPTPMPADLVPQVEETLAAIPEQLDRKTALKEIDRLAEFFAKHVKREDRRTIKPEGALNPAPQMEGAQS